MKYIQKKVQAGFLVVVILFLATQVFSTSILFNTDANINTINVVTPQLADEDQDIIKPEDIHQLLQEYPALQQPLKQKDSPQQKAVLPFTGFIQNIGQKDNSNVNYYYTTTNMSIGFGASTIYFQYTCSEAGNQILAFNVTFPGSNTIIPAGNEQLLYTINYFIGNNRYMSIPAFQEIYYHNIYSHIDLRYYMAEQGIKYEYIVNPGGDPTQITMQVNGAVTTDIRNNGVFISPINSLDSYLTFDENLTVYQVSKIILNTIFTPKTQTNSYGFTIGDFNSSLPLIIDPYILRFGTYLGGTGEDAGYGIAMDAAGNIYITGQTTSSDFFTKNAYDASYNGGNDVFITKLNATGNGLVFSTYFGGTGDDYGNDIAVDAAGNIYVTGQTTSSDFPSENAYDNSYNDGNDVFIIKLNATGDGLVFSTYLGGTGDDYGNDIAVDTAGNIYVTGHTTSGDFPTKNAYDTSYNGGSSDVFITKLNTTGDGLVFSTYLGGTGDDSGYGIAVDTAENIYMTGHTTSGDFPTKNAYDASYNGGSDVFITKLNATGDGLVFSTYLGGMIGFDSGYGIAVDTARNIYVTGVASSGDFPTKNAYDTSYNGGSDVFVTKLNATGNGLIFSSFLGGTGDDSGNDIAVDAAGNVYVTGITSSINFPTRNAYDTSYNGGTYDAFVTKLNTTGNGLVFSTFLGGIANDSSSGIAVDVAGNIYVTGYTTSGDFPTKNAYNPNYNGDTDIFVTEISNIFSTYLGGTKADTDPWIAVDTAGNVYVTGITSSSDFPTRNAYDTSYNGGTYDIFITKLNTTGNGLVFSTYLGGTGNDYVNGIAVDAAGNIYIAGQTTSDDFPTKSAYDASYNGNSDSFVTKLNTTGNGLVFSTYLGGAGSEIGSRIALDTAGNIYVTGYTTSSDFPTINAYDTSYNGSSDIFITKLNTTGNGLLFSTYFGGTGGDSGSSIAVDMAGNIYITGTTTSDDFPTKNAYDVDYNGGSDGFVTKLNTTGNGLTFSTYFGGTAYDAGSSIAVDTAGNIYVVGYTTSSDFPTINAYDTSFNGGSGDVFITKLNTTGNGLTFSTYLGGTEDDSGSSIAVDTAGNIYVTGYTTSSGFPIKNAYDTSYNGSSDGFITKLNTTGNGLLFSTFLGGAGSDSGSSIAVDTAGNIYVTGYTTSSDFPTINAYDASYNGGTGDTFVAKIAGLTDTNAPQINLNTPNNFSLHCSAFAVQLEITDLSGLSTVLYNWNNNSNTILLPPYTISLTTEGQNILHIFATDIYGNSIAKTYVFTLDTITPTISSVNLLTMTYYRTGTLLSFAVTDSTSGVQNVWYHWDTASSNNSLSLPYHLSLPTGEGQHTLYLYANDTAGNIVAQMYIFRVDNTSPVIILTSPLNRSVQKSTTPIDVSIVDILAGVQNVWYHWDTAGTNTSLPVGTSNTIPLPAVDGRHLLTLYAQDAAGNSINADFTFVVDNTAPSEITSGIADGITVNMDIPIQILCSDINGIAYTLLKLDGSMIYNTTSNTFNFTLRTRDYQNGNHVFTVEVFDIAGNVFTQDYHISINNTGFSFLGFDLGTLLSLGLAIAIPIAGLVYWKSYGFRNRKLIRDYLNDVSIEGLAKKYKKTQHKVEEILRKAKKIG